MTLSAVVWAARHASLDLAPLAGRQPRAPSCGDTRLMLVGLFCVRSSISACCRGLPDLTHACLTSVHAASSILLKSNWFVSNLFCFPAVCSSLLLSSPAILTRLLSRFKCLRSWRPQGALALLLYDPLSQVQRTVFLLIRRTHSSVSTCCLTSCEALLLCNLHCCGITAHLVTNLPLHILSVFGRIVHYSTVPHGNMGGIMAWTFSHFYKHVTSHRFVCQPSVS